MTKLTLYDLQDIKQSNNIRQATTAITATIRKYDIMKHIVNMKVACLYDVTSS